MTGTGQNTKDALIAATIRLTTQRGARAATVRAIARESGITEGAVYRHYVSKDDLRWQSYKQVVEEMLLAKQHLRTKDVSIRQKLREWIKLSYTHFDKYPEAFTYVLLIPAPVRVSDADSQITFAQGALFIDLVKEARIAGEVRDDIAPELALSHFTGLMLNVPRLINEGQLQAPASQFIDEVADAVWRILRRQT